MSTVVEKLRPGRETASAKPVGGTAGASSSSPAQSPSPTLSPSPAVALGHDLRALRKSNNLTLADLADSIGRSVGYLSQVERGMSSPSIDDLRAIARVLDVPVGLFFMADDTDPADRGVIVRAGARRQLGTVESGIVEELLSPDLGGSFEMFRSRFEPGAELAEPIRRDTEEAGYLVSGCLDLWIDGRHYQLHAGDTFRFDHKSYRWRNPGSEPAIVIWVVSPPVY